MLFTFLSSRLDGDITDLLVVVDDDEDVDTDDEFVDDANVGSLLTTLKPFVPFVGLT